MDSLQRIFIGWNAPIVSLAIERLVSTGPSAPFDFSRILIIVPTVQSGRRLRKALAIHAAQHHTGLIPPRTVTPEFLLHPRNSAAACASQIQISCTWLEVLQEADMAKLDCLFPQKIDFAGDIKQALDIAGKLTQLRDQLSDNGLTIQDVALQGLEAVEDVLRWSNMASLEHAYLEQLSKTGLRDPIIARIEGGRTPAIPENTERIIMLAVADPTPLSLAALDSLSAAVPVEIWVHAPEDKKDMFDCWGKPVPDAWRNAQIPLPELSNIRVRDSADAQAQEIINILTAQGCELDYSRFAISAPNKSLIPFVQKIFLDNHIPTYDPAGEPLGGHSLYKLIESVRNILTARDYESFAQIARNPAFIAALKQRFSDFNAPDLLKQLDILQNAHLPQSLDDIGYFLTYAKNREYKEISTALEAVRTFLAASDSVPAARWLRDFLAFIYSADRIDTITPHTDSLLQAARAVDTGLAELESAQVNPHLIPAHVQLDILLDSLRKKSLYPQHPPEIVAVQGWLEMPWEEAGIIIFAGMNEGCVPESVVGDVFLPDKPRERLGLKSNSARFARDIYLFASMLHARPAGNVYCIVGRSDARGDPLQPSRLLFACPDSELTQRAAHVFGGPGDLQEEAIAPSMQWKLRPPVVSPPQTIRATAFRDYLQCPFRFYLRHCAGMEKADDRKVELDALDFGNACHRPLALLAAHNALKDCSDERALAEFLQIEAEKAIKDRFGNRLSLTLSVQLETIKQRLAMAAQVEAGLRKEGWKTVLAEHRCECSIAPDISDMSVRATIDRIDVRDNVVRILDYKTGDAAEDPEKAHIKNARADAPSYACFSHGGTDKMWLDLQLPLYCLLILSDAAWRGHTIQCGYFNLPKALQDTGVHIWESFDTAHLDSARECAQKILRNIRDSVFWPPADAIEYDDFRDLYVTTLREATDGNYFARVLSNVAGN